MSENDSDEFKFGQQVWLYAGAKLETWFLGKTDKGVLLSTEDETPGTLYRMKGTSTLFHDKASAMQSRVEILLSEICEKKVELQAVRNGLKAVERRPGSATLGPRRHNEEGGLGL